MGVVDGFSRDEVRNFWLGEEHVGIELDDRVPEGEEKNDDIPPDNDGDDDDDGTCGADAGVAAGEEEEEETGEDPQTDEQEAAALARAATPRPAPPASPAPTEGQYERYLRDVDMPPQERGGSPKEGTAVHPLGEVAIPAGLPAA